LFGTDRLPAPAGNIQFDNGPADVADGEVLNQQDPAFCNQFPASPAELRQGSCPGADNTGDGGNNYTGGTWFRLIGSIFNYL
jgi:L-ascorbate oxidase